ncbi:cupin domain-containing protein [Microbulbifer sp. SAOS-129_SWC]|uniref:cupin domain-containing protein n=1 Tax=Microbulbifer sp. SAOS-129_SWC TaxID=3145235 RepID=UPI0032175E4D
MADKDSALPPADAADGVGARLKVVRKVYGWSQRELAKRAGVTNATISLIEQGRVSPSVGSLQKILDGIPLSLAVFFALDMQPGGEPVFYRAEELPELAEGPVRGHRLGGAGRQLALLRRVFAPGQDSGVALGGLRGEEGGFVVSGQLEVTIGAEVALLGAGDGYYFDRRRPHRLRNPGDADCILISACSPPSG